MKVSLRRTSFIFLVAVLMSVFAMVPAFAEEDKLVIAVSEDQELIIDSYGIVKKEKVNGDMDLHYINGVATVSFGGYTDYGYQDITYYPEAQLKDGKLELGEGQEAEFEEKYYVVRLEGEPPMYTGKIPVDVEYLMSGMNYAHLKKEGFYKISYSASPKAEKKSFFLHVTIVEQWEELEEELIEEPYAVPEQKPELKPAIAVPTASKVVVDGKEVAFEAYNINGNNYFKLRDLAQAVNGSEKQFQVGWDAYNNAISLMSESEYTSVGGELEASGATGDQQAEPSSSKLMLDLEDLELDAYNINGNNYFKLRDIAGIFNIGVTWNGELNTVGIDTSIDYKAE